MGAVKKPMWDNIFIVMKRRSQIESEETVKSKGSQEIKEHAY